MESKKAEHLDLEKNRSSILLLGLVCGTALTLMSFEYANYEFKQEKNLMGITESGCTLWAPAPIMPIEPTSTPLIKQESKSEEFVEDEEVTEEEVVKTEEEDSEQNDNLSLLPPDLPPGIGGPSVTTTFDSIEEPTIPDVMPYFPGGNEKLYPYLSDKLIYPELCKHIGVQGKAYVQFTVEKDGSITDIQVVKSPHTLFSKESSRVVGEMPKWEPGYKDNKKVRVRFTLPINFVMD